MNVVVLDAFSSKETIAPIRNIAMAEKGTEFSASLKEVERDRPK